MGDAAPSLFSITPIGIRYGDRHGQRPQQTYLVHDLAKLIDWFSAHAMKVNAKTQLMVFGSRNSLRNSPDFIISLRDVELQPRARRNVRKCGKLDVA